jgi:hypothetical protein
MMLVCTTARRANAKELWTLGPSGDALLASWADTDKHNGERQGFAYWNGYTPAKGNPDGTLTPLRALADRRHAGLHRDGRVARSMVRIHPPGPWLWLQ